jgi:hypothetical protein
MASIEEPNSGVLCHNGRGTVLEIGMHQTLTAFHPTFEIAHSAVHLYNLISSLHADLSR